MKKYFLILSGFLISSAAFSWEDTEVKTHFPIDHYFTQISDWINPNTADYDVPLPQSSVWQAAQMKNFYNHYVGDESPWSSSYITSIYQNPKPDNKETRDLKSVENKILHDKSNSIFNYDEITDQYIQQRQKTENELGYDGFDQNAKPHSDDWINLQEDNVNLSQFDSNKNYNPSDRAIAIDNLNARVLPTDDIYALNYKLPGEGKPFDYLQMSVIWAGTPVYILGESKDHAWYLVASPDVNAWVKSRGVVRVDDSFVTEWQSNAYKHGLIAIAQTKIPIKDETNKALFESYVGAIFPLDKSNDDGYRVLVPPAADDQQPVRPRYAYLYHQQAVSIPLSPTPYNFVHIMKQLINRPYGWGNYKFHNDCSGEMKNFYVAFGIWLPRNSLSQISNSLGTIHDYGILAPADRIESLKNDGHKYMTLVYIGGHIFMYIGNYRDQVLTYQNIWGLRPTEDAIKAGDHDRRAVIGKSGLFPLLLQYPEDTRLSSLAAKSFFKTINLDELALESQFLKLDTWLSRRTIDLAPLMVPEE